VPTPKANISAIKLYRSTGIATNGSSVTESKTEHGLLFQDFTSTFLKLLLPRNINYPSPKSQAGCPFTKLVFWHLTPKVESLVSHASISILGP